MSTIKYKLSFEIITIIGAALIALLFLVPIYLSSHNYAFYLSNFLFIFLFITFTRYIFFLKYTPLSHFTPIKVVYIFITIPLAVFLTDSFSAFQAYSDTIGIQEFVKNMEGPKQVGTIAYIKNQMLFFGAGSVVATVLLAFRMILSIWRVRNRNEV